MDNHWNRSSQETRWPLQAQAPAEAPQTDDPLGDEAAFPTTWQQLGDEIPGD